MLIHFAVSMLGYWAAHRIVSSILTEFAIPLRHREVSLVVLAVIAGLMVSTKDSPAVFWLFIGILLQTLKFFPFILRFFFRRKLQSSLTTIVDIIILHMQGGNSFRISVHAAMEYQSGWLRNQMQEIYQFVFSSEIVISPKDAVVARFTDDLRRISQSQSRHLDQLKALRRELKIIESFRRRSGQVTQQLKMQAIIVTAMYLGLLIFVIGQFGFESNRYVVILSFIIFVVGICWMFLVGRRMKWKV